MKNLLLKIILLLFICLPLHKAAAAELHNLSSEFYFRWGDSPIDDNGEFIWANEVSTENWEKRGRLDIIYGEKHHNTVWYRVKIPAIKEPNTAIYFPHVLVDFTVYLNGEAVFQSDYSEKFSRVSYATVRSYMVPLPQTDAPADLFLRIRTPEPYLIGICSYPQPVYLGLSSEIISKIMWKNLDSVILGGIYILLGIILSFFFFRRWQHKNYFMLSIALYLITMGMHIFFLDPASLLISKNIAWNYYLGFTGVAFFSVFIYLTMDLILEFGKTFRRLWQLHLALAIIAVLADLSCLMPFPLLLNLIWTVFFLTILISLRSCIKVARIGSRQGKLLAYAFMVLAITGLHDIGIGMGIVPFIHWLSPYGSLIFLFFLGLLLESKYTRNQRKLELYSKRLEYNARKLNKYSHILEQKVAERTLDLQEKNVTLNKTMSELKDAQVKLVQSEKMAALGNLVAGIAHEVNNPVGAMNSAVDVQSRCIIRIEGILGVEKYDELRESPECKKTFNMLKKNNQLISLAIDRVAHIVKSLKNFARLDESDFQKAEIHSGIESTLTLIHHELKNRITVKKEFAELPPIECYPNELNQVFMNLFINAAHAIKGEGTILIKTQQKQDNVFIDIADSGIGIPPENISRIFDPGFTTKGVGVGTGLGLSISYKIIHKHNGEISAESKVGEGTTLTIRLPINQQNSGNTKKK